MKRLTCQLLGVAVCLFGLTAGCESSSGQKSSGEMKTAQQEAEKAESEGKDKAEEKKKEGKDKADEKKEEHHGDEHHGDEHPGEEHPGEEHPGDKAKKKGVTPKAIKMAIESHIESKSNDKGVFKIKDSKTGETLKLKFVKIHEPVRKLKGKAHFACTDFHVVGSKKKLYDLDFWLNPNKKTGKLEIVKSKIHKHPVKKNGKWTKKARFTYKKDQIVDL